ncbi:hypothetical protein V6N00_13580 [Tersicoccus sp. MR15.9]|uniref:hypothetical protein n=1 Tax=Tersicoccus mangrovi TaxID=3121635 RepID=UPI002FE53753
MSTPLPLAEFIRRYEEIAGAGAEPLPEHLWAHIQTVTVREAAEADSRDAAARLSVQRAEDALART